jgi:hypothetical protein
MPYTEILRVNRRQEEAVERIMALPRIEERLGSPELDAFLREQGLLLEATARESS